MNSLAQTCLRRAGTPLVRRGLDALTVVCAVVLLTPVPVAVKLLAALGVLVVLVVEALSVARAFPADRARDADPADRALHYPVWAVGLVATAAWPWVRDGHVDVVAVVGAVVLGAALVFLTTWGGDAPFMAQFPGTPDGQHVRPRLPAAAGALVAGLAVVAFAAAVALDAPAWALGVVVVAAGAAGASSLHTATRNVLGRRAVARAVAAYQPDFVMAYAGRSGAPSQLRMWESYLLASGLKCLIINLRPKYAALILEHGNITSPFVQLGSHPKKELDAFLPPSVKAIFYVQNAIDNAYFMSRKEFTHVWIHHGDTDKPGNFNERHVLYDKLVVAGPAALDRYERHGIHIPREKFEILGRPQNAEIRRPERPISEVENPVVLYAPTWQGLDDEADFSSLHNGPQIVRALLDRGATVIFRAHPLSKRWKVRRVIIKEIQDMLREDRKVTGRKHISGPWAEKKRTVADVTNESDALISDLCGVASDYLMSTKPYAISSMRDTVEEFREKYFFTRTAYVLKADLSNIDEVLDDLLGADPFAAERHRSKEYVLGTLEGQDLIDAFVAFVRRTVGVSETADLPTATAVGVKE